MEITLYRNQNPAKGTKYKLTGYSIGHLYINGKYFCDTIEDEDRGSTLDMTFKYDSNKKDGKYYEGKAVKAVKKYGITAIPRGKYELLSTVSETFKTREWAKPYKGKIPLLVNAKTGKEDFGYGGVRIHPLNTAKDSCGCIGLGLNKFKGRVDFSTKYFSLFMNNYFVPAINKKEKVYLNIV